MMLSSYDEWKTRSPDYYDDPREVEQWEEEQYFDSIGWDARFGFLDDNWIGWEPVQK